MAVSEVLGCHQVSLRYDERLIIDKLSFHVTKGEFVSLLAPSGGGKSTIFKMINGLLEPDSGEIHLNGLVAPSRLGKVGYMPQKDLLLPWRTIEENAAIPLEIRGFSRKEAGDIVQERLCAFGLYDYAKAYPNALSGGMRQRVSLLRATLSDSELLLLDEPFSALDGITRTEMQEWLLAWCVREQRTILFVTHDIEEALLLSDRILVANNKPIREVKEYKVEFVKPRHSSLRFEPLFVHMRKEMLSYLQGGMADE
ncbi:ABC transporter ATP-binding protein [Brevibacillus daliensis]|uniref:ABC transporter ATP-binding protein n=1 Tax=Brevibacillus daliensis TaxID=2892995 RepID=UPI001E648312|nr:ABC transporter ATP-binding protein [Brevibacillus daliensis]